MCGESYILALCGGTSGCEGRSCCTLCRCVKVYLADTTTTTTQQRISHFSDTPACTVQHVLVSTLAKVDIKK